jgi:hypothetical protein
VNKMGSRANLHAMKTPPIPDVSELTAQQLKKVITSATTELTKKATQKKATPVKKTAPKTTTKKTTAKPAAKKTATKKTAPKK